MVVFAKVYITSHCNLSPATQLVSKGPQESAVLKVTVENYTELAKRIVRRDTRTGESFLGQQSAITLVQNTRRRR